MRQIAFRYHNEFLRAVRSTLVWKNYDPPERLSLAQSRTGGSSHGRRGLSHDVYHTSTLRMARNYRSKMDRVLRTILRSLATAPMLIPVQVLVFCTRTSTSTRTLPFTEVEGSIPDRPSGAHTPTPSTGSTSRFQSISPSSPYRWRSHSLVFLKCPQSNCCTMRSAVVQPSARCNLVGNESGEDYEQRN